MRSLYKVYLFIIGLLLASVSLLAQEGSHPRIYITDVEKDHFLQSIETTDWKNEIVQRKRENVEKYMKLCEEDPEWLVSRLQMNWKTKHNKVYLKGGNFAYSEGDAPVPTVRFSGTRDWATDYKSPTIEEVEPYFDDERGMFLEHKSTGHREWVHPSKSGHIIEKINERIMDLVADAAFLYWVTGDEKYAEFAAPVYDTYIKGMYYREAPFDLDSTNQHRLSGLATFEVIHEGIVVPLTTAFDFMYDYFIEHDFDQDISAAVFQKWAGQIIANGVPDNNWNFFQARFLTYIALALDDNAAYENGKGQEYYLEQTFDITSERQIALKEAILVYDQDNGIWPESPSYSMHVTTTLLRILTLLDNVTNGDEFKNYPIVEKASLAAFQYLFPNGYTVGFGDSGHDPIPSENFELLIANYRKHGDIKNEILLTGMLKNNLKAAGDRRGGRNLFELFFYVDELTETEDVSNEELLSQLTTPTFYAPNVSLFIQRMGTKDDAMMVSTVGSFGNHAHVNGIAIELYANNYVLAPDMGRGPSYWHPDHRDYYSRFPAHNTVVVDGISDYDAMRSYHPFSLDNFYPKHGVDHAGFDEVSFSKVSFTEPKTQSDQQRFTAMINSEDGNGYIVDIFRSRKKYPGDQKHEYFYHNLGQRLTILDEMNNPLSLTPTEELGTNEGDMKAYDYLTHNQTLISDKDLKAIFTMKSEGQADNFMKVWIKGGVDQQLFSVMAPKSNALKGGTSPGEMIGQNIPTLIIRKNHEAWSDPFVTVFNPYIDGKDQIISHVAFEESVTTPGGQIINIKHSDEKTKDQFVLTTSTNDVVDDEEMYLNGLLAMERNVDDQLDFIFVAGVTRYEADDWRIVSIAQPATVSIEKCDEGFIIQNDMPVMIGMPKELKPQHILYYVNGELASQRVGVVGRRHPEQVEFRLEVPYEKVIVVLEK